MGLHERVPINRRARRLDLDTRAVVRDPRGRTTHGKVVDITSHGCQIELGSGDLRPGQFVSLQMGTLESWLGIVRWGGDKIYGIEFANQLYGPVVEHLVHQNPSLNAIRTAARTGFLPPRRSLRR